MKKLILISILFLISSCSSDETSLSTVNNDESQVTNESENSDGFYPRINLSSDINYSSGTMYDNFYSPVKIPSIKTLSENTVGSNNTNSYREQLHGSSYRYFDYNSDGKVDLFGYMNRYGQSFINGHGSGKLVLYSDVHGEFELISEIEVTRAYQGLVEMNDFDNDGLTEFIVYGNEDHETNEGGSIVSTKKPLSYIDISLNGDLIEKYIGPVTSNHDISSGDIDNDGDVDIVASEWWFTEGNPNKNKLVFYINDGNGNFSIERDRLEFDDNFEKSNSQFIKTSIDLYDINNDNILDIVVGDILKQGEPIDDNCIDYNGEFCGNFSNPMGRGVHIIFGKGSGQFSIKNSIFIESELFAFEDKVILGFTFLDFNNDGYDDIILNGVYDVYKTGFIEVIYNNDNNQFSKQETLDMWLNLNPRLNVSSIITTPYTLQLVDVDLDNRLDFRLTYEYEPGDYESGWYLERDIMGPNFYWKNSNGKLIRNVDVFRED